LRRLPPPSSCGVSNTAQQLGIGMGNWSEKTGLFECIDKLPTKGDSIGLCYISIGQ
jgi:hypothetical protein